ncbi:hypothetical protein [Microbacterium sp. LWH3-1.2]|uniref:hypothetical protein n=1 Tax=Microbacterium sp. LWH3-1.2 TaxID=3135256 RepID=UPI0039C95A95
MTAPQNVGGKLPDLNGLLDPLGNAGEWTWDVIDPARYADYRVFPRRRVRRGRLERPRIDAPRRRPAHAPRRRRLPRRARRLRHGRRGPGLVGPHRRRARRVRRRDAAGWTPRR